ncbi:hypothetical protein CIPAW_05G166900 [Carya illinoinensis]|uniref:Uncharacterized protein n=1 Tax=Carya illinoinensis TaxID=32201 RepID=A0A8T1QJ13_CARIL|nr:hypothetical protein CIPAW_05G166900 [Carya illinoinensis]KAG6654741.1 hypothetical protein CIPAW_05G166900 [Carya illinoinensis]
MQNIHTLTHASAAASVKASVLTMGTASTSHSKSLAIIILQSKFKVYIQVERLELSPK